MSHPGVRLAPSQKGRLLHLLSPVNQYSPHATCSLDLWMGWCDQAGDGIKEEEIAMSKNDAFVRWFRQATGHEPYPFQICFACEPMLLHFLEVATTNKKADSCLNLIPH